MSLPPRASWLAVLLVGAAIAVSACGGTPAGPTGMPTFTGAPFQSMTSAAGLVQVDVRSSPQPPIKGQNAVELVFTGAGGVAVSGLEITVVPWMPAHGHGGSVAPLITETAPGVFVADPVLLYMSGHWELRIAIAGTIDDAATPTVDIP